MGNLQGINEDSEGEMRQSSTRFFIQKNKRIVTDIPRDCSGCNHCRHIGRGYCYCDAGETIFECRRYPGRALVHPGGDFDWSLISPTEVAPEKISDRHLGWILSEANTGDDSDYGRGYRDAMRRILEYFHGNE